MTDNNLTLNKFAKEYIPKKMITNNNSNNIIDRPEESKVLKDNTIKLNINAFEYKPKKINEFIIEGLDDEDDLNDVKNKDDKNNEIKENNNKTKNESNVENDSSFDEFSIINKEIENFIMEQVDEESEESIDKEDWYPDFKNCSCCKGYVYKCEGNSCQSLGMCFCKAAEEYDPDTIYNDSL